MPADVKDVLYSTINEIGREKIRMEIAANIKKSEKYCREIMDKCMDKLGQVDDDTLATLCEALLHFMLTASLLPSERKVKVRGADLDIVIPSTKVLEKNADRALLIQVIARTDLASKVRQAESMQPHRENIWLVSIGELQTNHKNYRLDSRGLHYSHIVSDIGAFLSEKGDRGLKLLHGQ